MSDGSPPIRPFADFFREQSGGKTHDEMSEAIYDVVQKVRDTGKAGSVTLTFKISTLKGDENVLVIEDAIKVRMPEHDRKASMFFPDKHGNLSRSDPRQLAFESLREVPPPANVDLETGEIKEVN